MNICEIGGTTVRDTMNNILPGIGRTIWYSYRNHIREFMSHLFMFGHLRDPITRTISSYFELHRRNETDLIKNHMIGMDIFRYLLSMMENRMDCSLTNTLGDIYFNMHLMPQMYFLTEASNPWKIWPVNYVGNMSELYESTFEIFYHFYWNTSDYIQFENKTEVLSYNEALIVFKNHYHHGRDRHFKKYLNGGERRGEKIGTKRILYTTKTVDKISEGIIELRWLNFACTQ